jgi:undecaprenyl-diphosphatase
LGFDVAPPSLAVSAVLHLGTLAAVLIYLREDVGRALHFRTDPEGRKVALMVLIGTIPAALFGIPFAEELNRFQSTVSNVGWALMGTGLILYIGQLLARGSRVLSSLGVPDAVIIGLGQAVALIPGISRSGTTISTGNARSFQPSEAARFSFLLSIPAIAGGGILELILISDTAAFGPELLVGAVAAALSGYFAIGLMLKSVNRIGLFPFAAYCLVLGTVTVFVF